LQAQFLALRFVVLSITPTLQSTLGFLKLCWMSKATRVSWKWDTRKAS